MTPKSQVFHALFTLKSRLSFFKEMLDFLNLSVKIALSTTHSHILIAHELKLRGLSQPLDLKFYRERRAIPTISNLIFYVCLENILPNMQPTRKIVRYIFSSKEVGAF